MNKNIASKSVSRRPLQALGLCAALLMMGTSAQAQTGGSYAGLQLGRSDFKLPCGALYGCDSRDTSWKLSVGQHMTPHFGTELSLIGLGKVGRAGGDTSANAANLSLVGRIPLDRFTLFGKLGASYARTKVSTGPLSDIPSGKASGWGPSGAVGVSYELTPGTSLVAEWERQRIEFAGTGRSDIDNTSVGVRWNF
jgi:OmpA-OmpF porin, OOP family